MGPAKGYDPGIWEERISLPRTLYQTETTLQRTATLRISSRRKSRGPSRTTSKNLTPTQRLRSWHSFVKNTNRTPTRELDPATTRLKEVKSENP